MTWTCWCSLDRWEAGAVSERGKFCVSCKMPRGPECKLAGQKSWSEWPLALRCGCGLQIALTESRNSIQSGGQNKLDRNGTRPVPPHSPGIKSTLPINQNQSYSVEGLEDSCLGKLSTVASRTNHTALCSWAFLSLACARFEGWGQWQGLCLTAGQAWSCVKTPPPLPSSRLVADSHPFSCYGQWIMKSSIDLIGGGSTRHSRLPAQQSTIATNMDCT